MPALGARLRNGVTTSRSSSYPLWVAPSSGAYQHPAEIPFESNALPAPAPKPDRALSLILKKLNDIWNVKSNGSSKTVKKPYRSLNLQLSDPLHRFINSAKVNRMALYGKTG